jgi:AraC-like DNA-binding protein
LIHAKEYILKGLPLAEVIVECGFGDYCNFLKAFKNEYSITPKQFADLYRKINIIEQNKIDENLGK